MKTRNQKGLESKYWLLIIVAACILCMAATFFAGVKSGPVRVIADYTVVPMQKGINVIGTWVNGVADNFVTLKSVQKENKTLKEQNANLKMENNQLQQKAVELERFYDLYKMDQNTSDYPKVGARVIANDGSNWFTSFTIDKGSADGIREDMNVLSGNGLVGIVTKVNAHSSTVRSIIDEVNISSMIMTTFDQCIVSGDLKLINNGVVKFEQLANNENEVAVGEQIVTSNISSKYLQGLLIGYVSEVNVDSNNLTRSGYIIPAVDFKKLQEVLVITATKQDLIDNGNQTQSDSSEK